MTNLSSIEAEASRLVGRLPEPQRRTLQQALVELCEAHWRELRGRQPATPLAGALWSTMPPLADVCADLCATHDVRVDDVLQGRKPAQAFALIALTEIERGNAEGARVAYEPMMLFQSAEAGARYAEEIAAALRGKLEAPHLHPHGSSPPLIKALGLIAAQTGRFDLSAMLRVISLLVAPEQTDDALQRLQAALNDVGVRFIAIDSEHIQFELHGHAHKPVGVRHVGEMLAEIRQERLP